MIRCVDLVPAFHRVLAEWDLPQIHHRALLGGLALEASASDAPRTLAADGTVDQTIDSVRRVRGVLAIHSAMAPLLAGPAAVALLRHPSTAPGGAGAALDVMCAGVDGLAAVASHFWRIPGGPLLLPGVLGALLDTGLLEPSAVAAAIGTQLARAAEPDHGCGATAQLLAFDRALRKTAWSFQRTVLLTLLETATCTPPMVAWTARTLSRERARRGLLGAPHRGAFQCGERGATQAATPAITQAVT